MPMVFRGSEALACHFPNLASERADSYGDHCAYLQKAQ
jgi:hypothetical protein